MSKNVKRNITALILAILVMIFFVWRNFASSGEWFVEYPLPLKETQRLFDIGIVDANGDGNLDIYTSNHHFRQSLLIANGKGGYRDVLSDWGLDQSREFPGAELSFSSPEFDKPGVYIFWRGTNLIIRAHQTSPMGSWKGSMHVFDPVDIIKSDGIRAYKQEKKTGKVTETKLFFESSTDGTLVLTPGGQGLPIRFELDDVVTPDHIFVGLGKVNPSSTSFTLAMQDRHAHAWADYNDDGLPDVFINRGALSGTLRAHTPETVSAIKDELFLSQNLGSFVEGAAESGIDKKGCSGRHAKWVDFNADGLLDLFINCYDRDHLEGDFPKQLYMQVAEKKLLDIADKVGLGLPDQQMGNLVWFDADNDGDADLFAFQDEGLFLYRNEIAAFKQEAVANLSDPNAPKIGHGGGNYWFYDGKLSVADYDSDGDLDVFFSSKRGNRLLLNQGGNFEVVDLANAGLPRSSATANWVDFDNDGLPDLHLFPQGIYRQLQGGKFKKTGLLAFHPNQYQAAIINWFDRDNDGRLDVVMALDPNPEYKPWWEFYKKPRQRGRWEILSYRNVGTTNHWLQIKLTGANGNRSAIGTHVTIVTSASKMQTQEVGSNEGASFSQGHHRLYYGIGANKHIDLIKIRWSDGSQQVLRNLEGDRLVSILQQTDQNPNSNTDEAKQ